MAQDTKSKSSSKKGDTAGSPETNNALATTGAANLPSFMAADAGRGGKENIARDDMVIPRVALTQAVSPEAIDGRCEVGHFFHTVLEEDLGPELDIVIVHHSKRYTLWNPRHSGGGVLARASDGKRWDADWEGEIQPSKDSKRKVKFSVKAGEPVGRDVGLGRWGTLDPENEDSPPAATLTHVLVCVAKDRLDFGPFVVLLQRAAEPVAKQLLTKVQLDQAPIFGQRYLMSSKDQAGATGDGFKQFTFTKNGHVDTEELYLFCKKQNENLTESGVKFDEAAEQPEDRGGDGGDDSGGDDRY